MGFNMLRNYAVTSKSFCFIQTLPVGIPIIHRSSPKKGLAIGDEYPRTQGAVTISLNEDVGGLELPSRIANTCSLLILHRDCAAFVVDEFDAGEYETLPFRLVNQKGRTHSDDYELFNPIGCVDCLNRDRSAVHYRPDGSVSVVNDHVFDGDRMPEGRDLLRIPEYPYSYFFSQRLVEALEQKGFNNFLFDPVEVI